jgi:hypothetical protein
MKVRNALTAIALAAGLAGTQAAFGQAGTLDFQNGTDQGFGTGFGNDASKTFNIVNIGGSLRMAVPDTASFQEAGRETSNPAEPFYQALAAGALNESGYALSYDWYVDTSGGGYGTFMQLGTYMNSGSGFYAQDFPNTGKEVELNGTQLASGLVFSGHVDVPLSTFGNIPDADTFFRPGFIINGDGTTATVYFDNVSVHPIPEPATFGLIGLAASGLMLRRRK